MELTVSNGIDDDVPGVFALRVRVAEDLTQRYGRGPWSSSGSDRGVRRAFQTGRVLVARGSDGIVGALTLATRKPWAIDPAYFTAAPRPLYLLDMIVDPEAQGRGVGRRMLDGAAAAARAFPAQAIRLDAYDAPAGAGPFYAKCGYREVGRVSYRGTPLIYYEQLVGT